MTRCLETVTSLNAFKIYLAPPTPSSLEVFKILQRKGCEPLTDDQWEGLTGHSSRWRPVPGNIFA